MMKERWLNPYYWGYLAKDKLEAVTHKKNSYIAKSPVISVGNINTGGSGKTPFIVYLVNLILKHKPEIKILVISKSYKGKLKSPKRVPDFNSEMKASNTIESRYQTAELFGDEPCFLKSVLGDKADVWSGPLKWKTLKAAEAQATGNNLKYDVVLIDDGFSHKRIKKDLNIVLFDVSRSSEHYRLLPLGHLREPMDRLSESDLVVLTKQEGVDLKQVKNYENLIAQYQGLIIGASYKTVATDLKQKYFLFCGLGHPQKILSDLKEQQVRLMGYKFYPDHYQYGVQDEQELLAVLSKHPSSTRLLTTEKDRVKLSSPELLKKTDILNVEVSLSEQEEGILYEKISRIL